MCRLRNIAMRDDQESVTTGQTDTQTDRQTSDKVIHICRCASQATQKRYYTFCVGSFEEISCECVVPKICSRCTYVSEQCRLLYNAAQPSVNSCIVSTGYDIDFK